MERASLAGRFGLMGFATAHTVPECKDREAMHLSC